MKVRGCARPCSLQTHQGEERSNASLLRHARAVTSISGVTHVHSTTGRGKQWSTKNSPSTLVNNCFPHAQHLVTMHFGMRRNLAPGISIILCTCLDCAVVTQKEFLAWNLFWAGKLWWVILPGKAWLDFFRITPKSPGRARISPKYFLLLYYKQFLALPGNSGSPCETSKWNFEKCLGWNEFPRNAKSFPDLSRISSQLGSHSS